MTRLLQLLSALGAFVLARSLSATPQNFSDLECAVAQFAFAFATSKLPSTASSSIRDALNVDWLCANASVADFLRPDIYDSLAVAANKHDTARALAAALPSAPSTTFYVATDGSDANPGTLQQPFATLARAAQAVRSLGPTRLPGSTIVFVRAGTYYMGGAPLMLSEVDSNVTWAAYPADAPSPVVLSGAVSLGSLTWTPWSGGSPGILVAQVNVSREGFTFARSSPSIGRAGPPPLVASLFVNGVRQVRARYPNGNPQDGTGICFSATQRPGEGCSGYSSCALGETGMQPAPAGVSVNGIGPNRGDSPTEGCSQCGHCGSFR